jgi:hypothetical protein
MRNHLAGVPTKEAGDMASIVVSSEISRSPDDVFAYVTDPIGSLNGKKSVVKAESSQTPPRVGTRARMTRRLGRRELTQSAELTELTPPTRWVVRGLDGPVRGNVRGRVEPLDNDTRSRVTIELELEGHGIGRLLLPLFVRRKAQEEMPRNMQLLKNHLERKLA